MESERCCKKLKFYLIGPWKGAGKMAVGVKRSHKRRPEKSTLSPIGDNDDVDKKRGCKDMHLGDALGFLNRDAYRVRLAY